MCWFREKNGTTKKILTKKQDQLNDLLLKIWNTLKSTILKEDNGG